MTTIFHNAQISNDKLREIILKNPQTLLPGLSFIDLQMSADEAGIIDFLGVDTNGRMVLVNFDVKANDQMLIDILAQIQWLKKNQGLIKRLFFSENVDFEKSPQIVLVGPVFSNKLQSAVKQISDKDIKLFNFKYIVSKSDDAIIFDEIFSQNKIADAQSLRNKILTEQPKEVVESPVFSQKEPLIEKPALGLKNSENIKKEKSPLYDVITLTPEEIAEFMDFDVALEQNQTSE
ncbi:MAG: hypothetical protein KJ915_02965 [Candidatus Omnitrophica bacterium]|nr:hypothetical protein [Candidatus Omnitrophota bacterium]